PHAAAGRTPAAAGRALPGVGLTGGRHGAAAAWLPGIDAAPVAVSAVPAAAAGRLRGRRRLAGRHAGGHLARRRRRLAAMGAGSLRPAPALLAAGRGRGDLPAVESAAL